MTPRAEAARRSSDRQVGFDVEDRRAVDGLDRADKETVAVDGADEDRVQADRDGTVR
jgi:hypothetical protein